MQKSDSLPISSTNQKPCCIGYEFRNAPNEEIFWWDQDNSLTSYHLLLISLLQFQFANVTWYVTLKTSTKSSCLTYTFTTNEKGFKSIKQVDSHSIIIKGKMFSTPLVRREKNLFFSGTAWISIIPDMKKYSKLAKMTTPINLAKMQKCIIQFLSSG